MPGGSKKGGGLETKKSTFYLRSGNKTPFKQMGSSPSTSQFTRSLQKRAFGVDVNPRDGAKILRTSTWNYNKMKKDYERRLTKSAPEAEDQSKVETTDVKTTEVKTTPSHMFSYGGNTYRKNPTTGQFEYNYASDISRVDDYTWWTNDRDDVPEGVDESVHIQNLEDAYNLSLETE